MLARRLTDLIEISRLLVTSICCVRAYGRETAVIVPNSVAAARRKGLMMHRSILIG